MVCMGMDMEVEEWTHLCGHGHGGGGADMACADRSRLAGKQWVVHLSRLDPQSLRGSWICTLGWEECPSLSSKHCLKEASFRNLC